MSISECLQTAFIKTIFVQNYIFLRQRQYSPQVSPQNLTQGYDPCVNFRVSTDSFELIIFGYYEN